jgi:hypothetical protein
MKIQFLFFVLNMHENFRVWPYAHKIKHFFVLESGNVLEIFGIFLKFWQKTSIFNFGSVSYKISLQHRY